MPSSQAVDSVVATEEGVEAAEDEQNDNDDGDDNDDKDEEDEEIEADEGEDDNDDNDDSEVPVKAAPPKATVSKPTAKSKTKAKAQAKESEGVDPKTVPVVKTIYSQMEVEGYGSHEERTVVILGLSTSANRNHVYNKCRKAGKIELVELQPLEEVCLALRPLLEEASHCRLCYRAATNRRPTLALPL